MIGVVVPYVSGAEFLSLKEVLQAIRKGFLGKQLSWSDKEFPFTLEV